jgi:hypothetical protein
MSSPRSTHSPPRYRLSRTVPCKAYASIADTWCAMAAGLSGQSHRGRRLTNPAPGRRATNKGETAISPKPAQRYCNFQMARGVANCGSRLCVSLALSEAEAPDARWGASTPLTISTTLSREECRWPRWRHPKGDNGVSTPLPTDRLRTDACGSPSIAQQSSIS